MYFDDLSVSSQIWTRGAYNRCREYGFFQQLSSKHWAENRNGIDDYRLLDPIPMNRVKIFKETGKPSVFNVETTYLE